MITSFQTIVDETSFFRDVNQEIMGILNHSIGSMKQSDLKMNTLGEEFSDFRQTFEEITEASYQITEMAEQLSHLNKELTHKING